MSERLFRRSTRKCVVKQHVTAGDAKPLSLESPLTTTVSSRKTKREHHIFVSPDAVRGEQVQKKRRVIPSSTAAFVKNNKRQTMKAIVSTASNKISCQRPTPEECAFAVVELGKLHPNVLENTNDIRNRAATSIPKGATDAASNATKPDRVSSFSANSCGAQSSVLDGVVATMLSQNTTSANSTRAFANLKALYQDWNQVAALVSLDKLIDAIRVAGLAQKRAQNIWNICKTLVEERGDASLEYLRDTPHTNAEIHAELLRFPGLGVKTVSCVLMFTLGRRNEFPVDTHVHRISKQHSWIPSHFSRDDAYEYLNSVIPNEYKMDLHCLLVQHGRECHRCAARGKPQFPPKDGTKLACPMVHLNSIASGQYTITHKVVTTIKKEEEIDVKVETCVAPDGVMSTY
ncbi:DNA-apurinic or apyrimidinic site lyase [Nitzschia inconspicua]|uniref:DNA-apurinic or apyrimidinic site lyase n=1 Tax=Nitzschia inconspicua TaxID=303405 RepID=A0A9K3KUW4_9STRA|nr:DNA-apurinic or apyrimidinic site lyase [Nitzschia inconspicua]